MVAVLERSVTTLQSDVAREIASDTRLRGAEIAVLESRGVVALTGTVDCYARKLAARDAAYRVPGVTEVLNDIDIRMSRFISVNDVRIGDAARYALRWHYLFAEKTRFRVFVQEGWVALEGVVDCLFAR